MTLPASPSSKEQDAYYRAAFLGLCALDQRAQGPRRFGPDADARWNAFRGDLQDSDRIDLLVRDLAVDHPAAFAPRVLFNFPGLTPDEPCGPDWSGPSAKLAAELLRSAPTATATTGQDLLRTVAALWELTPQTPDPALLSRIQPATRVVAAGAGAVLALAARCAERRDLDLADQTLLVADAPGVRQLFGLALAGLESARPARILTSHDPAPADFTADLLLVSPDATEAERAAAARLITPAGR